MPQPQKAPEPHLAWTQGQASNLPLLTMDQAVVEIFLIKTDRLRPNRAVGKKVMDRADKKPSEARPVFRIMAGFMVACALAVIVAMIYRRFVNHANVDWWPLGETISGLLLFGAIATRGRRSFWK